MHTQTRPFWSFGEVNNNYKCVGSHKFTLSASHMWRRNIISPHNLLIFSKRTYPLGGRKKLKLSPSCWFPQSLCVMIFLWDNLRLLLLPQHLLLSEVVFDVYGERDLHDALVEELRSRELCSTLSSRETAPGQARVSRVQSDSVTRWGK